MISIVTGYYNRKALFRRTLRSLRESAIKDFEVVAVDDGSSDEHRIEDLQTEFPFLKVVRLENEGKWYKNPCIPFNIGFRKAVGDRIIIQNPECLHLGDVLSYVTHQFRGNEYLAFACYSLDKEMTEGLDAISLDERTLRARIPFKNRVATFEGDEGWYNHSLYRPVAWHFCSVLSRHHLEELGGFDERYAMGRAHDDVELLHRIELMGLRIRIVENPMVLHQNHYRKPELPLTDEQKAREAEHTALLKRNRMLYHEVTLSGKPWKANVLNFVNDYKPAAPASGFKAKIFDRVFDRCARLAARWRNRIGLHQGADARRINELEEENRRLRKAVANQALDIEMLKESAAGHF